jgi:ATP-dependent Lon protease
MTYPTGSVPVLPLRNAVLYPGVSQLVSIGRSFSVSALKKAQASGWILTVAQKNSDKNSDNSDAPSLQVQDLYEIGTLCKIENVRGGGESGYQVLLRGVSRVRLVGNELTGGAFEASFEKLDDQFDGNDSTRKALLASLKELSLQILQLIPANTEQVRQLVHSVDDLNFLTSLSAANIEMPLATKQEILEEIHVKERAMRLLQIMQELKENLSVQQEIRSKLSSKMGETHRQNILREQMRTIREELGEGGDGADDLRKRIADAALPEEAQKVADQELKRLEQISTQSPEHHVIRNFLELMADLPWSKSAPHTDIDQEKAREILERDHFGLDKVKKRVLQHLAVMKLKKSTKGTILLFVGPPGVGKTSLGRSLAEALGRKFVRVSLGGVRDDAEIRGHRRTYVGAMPGRIISGLKRAGENNPVMMFDEIDKMARGYQGDPASAMLEVLDPEQNKKFVDHYLDTGFDLSKVVFLATANSLDTIPAPLLDRMEVIDVSGYTVPEKLSIAKRHLVPQELEEHGMKPEQLSISDEALLRLISSYTREAGVRELRRKIAEICRASSEKVLLNQGSSAVVISALELEELIGPERFQSEVAEVSATAGVVTGLAWTPMGGDILFIETTLMPGSGALTITGQLGEVMKESAQIGVSLLRSRLAAIAPETDFKKWDIHIHVPAGAIPKDGPSAGVTMLTSLASAFSKRKVSPSLAMTGEVTLRGAVTPVGGIKEKVIAAHRAGIKEIILPLRNQKDLREIPKEILDQLKFHFVDNVNEVLRLALGMEPELLNLDSTFTNFGPGVVKSEDPI